MFQFSHPQLICKAIGDFENYINSIEESRTLPMPVAEKRVWFAYRSKDEL